MVQDITTPRDGLHFDVPFQTYLDWDILSQSSLKECRESMSHGRAAFDGTRSKRATDDMILGSALHVAFLEPARMLEKVVLWEGGTRRGAGWDDFCDNHDGKAILTPGHHENLIGMVGALRQHPEARRWMSKIEAVEVSAVGVIEGVRVKGRCDALTPDPLVDLKKVRSTNPRSVAATVLAFGYHIQAAIYRRLFDRERFILFCVEGTPPYDVVPYELNASFLRLGEEEAASLLQQWRFCEKSGKWPGRSDEVQLLEPPDYAVPDVEWDAEEV